MTVISRTADDAERSDEEERRNRSQHYPAATTPVASSVITVNASSTR
jgi:hypothetical protein